MDGDARGGAALSIRSVTGQPLKFVGVGERSDALEAFFPDRVASRILGMGDVLSLIDKVQETIDQKEAEKIQEKLLTGDDFTLEDFRDQMKQIRKLGPLENILKMMPGFGELKNQLKDTKVDEKELNRIVAIIDSMTPAERRNHMIVNGSRRTQAGLGEKQRTFGSAATRVLDPAIVAATTALNRKRLLRESKCVGIRVFFDTPGLYRYRCLVVPG
jgi:signal recognition particle subunit SRP54